MKIELPFPSSLLSGHAKGNDQWLKVKTTKQHREWARLATLSARGAERGAEDGQATANGDIPITIRFIPPNNRGDRMNYPARMKPYVDGIAEALGVNDRRFHPCFMFCEPEKPGRVEVFIHVSNGKVSNFSQASFCAHPSQPVEEKTADASATNPRTRHNRNAVTERLV